MDDKERKFDVSDLNDLTKVESEDVSEVKNMEQDPYFDDAQVFEWDAYEFEYHQKSGNWVFGLIGGVVLISIFFALMSNWMGTVMVVASGLLLYQYAFKQPRKLHYVLTKEGLLIDDKPYLFKKMISYWISETGVLYVNAKWWPPRLSVQLDSVDVSEFDRFMEHYVKKEKRDENDTSDNISKWLKF